VEEAAGEDEEEDPNFIIFDNVNPWGILDEHSELKK